MNLLRTSRLAGWFSSVCFFLFGLVSIPPTALAETPDEGARLYFRNCASCHGATGEGDGRNADVYVARPRNLREGFLKQHSTEELVERVLSGRSLKLTLDEAGIRARDTEAVIRHIETLAGMKWELVSRGWDLYVKRCESCHGPYGRPAKNPPEGTKAVRDLGNRDVQASISERALSDAVRHGRHGMPALVPRIAEKDAPALAAFVRILSPGFEIYSRYCAACHGDDGHPVVDPGNAQTLPSVTFDRTYLEKHGDDEIRIKAWHMMGTEQSKMPHFTWLITERQARLIIDYLKSIQ